MSVVFFKNGGFSRIGVANNALDFDQQWANALVFLNQPIKDCSSMLVQMFEKNLNQYHQYVK